MDFYSVDELEEIGFKSLGRNVKISRRAAFFGVKRISIGDETRIDSFSVISAGPKGIDIGRNVHIASFCGLFGDEKITLEDFSGISSRVSIYSSNDDYSGISLTNPTIPDEFRYATSSPVTLCRHVIVGAGSTILPGVMLGEGVAVGALSMIRKNCEEWSIYSGHPAKRIKSRAKNLLELEKEYLKNYS